MKARHLFSLSLIVLVFALMTSLFLFSRLEQKEKTYDSLSLELLESRQKWEQIAAEKESLQAELKQVNETLRDASMTLEENKARSAELEKEIQVLQKETETLHRMLEKTDKTEEGTPT